MVVDVVVVMGKGVVVVVCGGTTSTETERKLGRRKIGPKDQTVSGNWLSAQLHSPNRFIKSGRLGLDVNGDPRAKVCFAAP